MDWFFCSRIWFSLERFLTFTVLNNVISNAQFSKLNADFWMVLSNTLCFISLRLVWMINIVKIILENGVLLNSAPTNTHASLSCSYNVGLYFAFVFCVPRVTTKQSTCHKSKMTCTRWHKGTNYNKYVFRNATSKWAGRVRNSMFKCLETFITAGLRHAGPWAMSNVGLWAETRRPLSFV